MYIVYIHIARLHLSFMSDDELFEKVKLWIVIKACNSNTFSGDCDTAYMNQPQTDFIIEMRGLKLIVWLNSSSINHSGHKIRYSFTAHIKISTAFFTSQLFNLNGYFFGVKSTDRFLYFYE